MTAVLGGCLGFSPGGSGDDPSPTAFRVNTLELRDPHAFLGGNDVTGAVNAAVADAMSVDSPPGDGVLDLSIVLAFAPLDQEGSTSPMRFETSDCTAPVDATRCEAGASPIETTATNGGDPCLDVVAGTTGGYTPAPGAPPAPCFASQPESFELPVGIFVLPLEDVQIAATYGGAPATRLTGMIRGFAPQSTLDSVAIPDGVPLIGGETLGSLVTDTDRDSGPGGPGYYVYFNFVADRVPYTAD